MSQAIYIICPSILLLSASLAAAALESLAGFESICGVAVFQLPRVVWKQHRHSVTALVTNFLQNRRITQCDCCKI
jgi:hypothetical protein